MRKNKVVITCHPCCLAVVTETGRNYEEVRQDTCLEQAIYYKEK